MPPGVVEWRLYTILTRLYRVGRNSWYDRAGDDSTYQKIREKFGVTFFHLALGFWRKSTLKFVRICWKHYLLHEALTINYLLKKSLNQDLRTSRL